MVTRRVRTVPPLISTELIRINSAPKMMDFGIFGSGNVKHANILVNISKVTGWAADEIRGRGHELLFATRLSRLKYEVNAETACLQSLCGAF